MAITNSIITNGEKTLLFTECFLIHPSEGVSVKVPANPPHPNTDPSNWITFQFEFTEDGGKAGVKSEASGKLFKVVMMNVLSSLAGGTESGLDFAIGSSQFKLYVMLLRASPVLFQFAISIYAL